MNDRLQITTHRYAQRRQGDWPAIIQKRGGKEKRPSLTRELLDQASCKPAEERAFEIGQRLLAKFTFLPSAWAAYDSKSRNAICCRRCCSELAAAIIASNREHTLWWAETLVQVWKGLESEEIELIEASDVEQKGNG